MASTTQFTDKILAGDREAVEALTRQAVAEKIPPAEIIVGYLSPAMAEVGRLYEEGELYVPEMLMCARAMQAGMEVIRPLIIGQDIPSAGSVVIGTVEGDLHDIGKTLAATMLEGAGFQVHNLGVDVKPAAFVEAVKTFKPNIVAMSALLTTTMPIMGQVVEALKEAGLRDHVKIIVGGAPLTHEFAAGIGADAYGADAASGARRAKELLGLK
jgi:5-methyltetrahydrofolate--homocysteine methyltransferase